MHAADGIARAREVLFSAVADAIKHSSLPLNCEIISVLEGSFAVIRSESDARPVALFDALLPHQDVFDEFAIDRTRKVATRLNIPTIITSTLQQSIVLHAQAVASKQCEEQQVLFVGRQINIECVANLEMPSYKVALLRTLKEALLVANQHASGGKIDHPATAQFLVSRLTSAVQYLHWCTGADRTQKANALQIVQQTFVYMMRQERAPEKYSPLVLPTTTTSFQLLLDILNAYSADGSRNQLWCMPVKPLSLKVLATRAPHCASALQSLVRFLYRFDLGRLSADEMNSSLAEFLSVSASWSQLGIPKSSVASLVAAVVAKGLSVGVDGLIESVGGLTRNGNLSEVNVLEIGPTGGTLTQELSKFLPDVTFNVTVASSRPTQNMMVELSELLLRNNSNFHVDYNAHVKRDEPWQLVCFTFNHGADRHLMQFILSKIHFAENGICVFFLPSNFLYHNSFKTIRNSLRTQYEIQWVVTSDLEPLATPDVGMCALIVKKKSDSYSPARFVYLRSSLDRLFEFASGGNAPDASIQKRASNVISYLEAGELGKMNTEAVVKIVPQQLLANSAWDEFVVPHDVLATMMSKIFAATTRLADIATVHSGLRTGATEVFAPTIREIDTEKIESEYWQRALGNSHADNIVITTSTELETISGVPASERRLLLIPPDRSALANTAVLARIESAEHESVHLRPSVKGREPWWSLRVEKPPSIIIPKSQTDRWLVALNAHGAFVTDSCIDVQLHNPECAAAVSVWMNSTVGLFTMKLLRSDEFLADVTVRDAEEFRVPSAEKLREVDLKLHKDFMHRHMMSFEDEVGATNREMVSSTTVSTDRLRLDKFFMETVFGFTPEEQRWMYRFTIEWWNTHTNIRHVAKALCVLLQTEYKVRPLSQWYGPRIEQLPRSAVQHLTLNSTITHAEHRVSMFTSQVAFYSHDKLENVIDYSSAAEAECIALLCNVGMRHIALPSDALLAAELLPELRTFQESLQRGLVVLIAHFPADLHSVLRRAVQEQLTKT
ncbi:MAG: hypothetical protein HQ472_01395 [Ignavibacteria bacterium]|nr:hypothetical protein [Ignavibacteria bacterium]